MPTGKIEVLIDGVWVFWKYGGKYNCPNQYGYRYVSFLVSCLSVEPVEGE